ncbi:MAG: AsnC family transcriptional regulator [Thermodesulfobacteriota bacterium]
MPMDDTDRSILNAIQSDFPLEQRPFAAVGRQAGLAEAEVVDRVKRLRQEGIIRRIGGNFVPEKLGYVSTLCAASVPEDRIDAFAEAVNAYAGVTHNYVRENRFNIWFTFIAPSRKAIAESLAEISRKTGVTTIINMPATRVFKIRAAFSL